MEKHFLHCRGGQGKGNAVFSTNDITATVGDQIRPGT